MNKKSRLGYSKNSPYRNSKYLDISTPSGVIDMSNTPRDLLGITSTGEVQFMRANDPNPYFFSSKLVREIPVNKKQYGGFQDYLSIIFDDEEEPTSSNIAPTAPSEEEINPQIEEYKSRIAKLERDNSAFALAMEDIEQPYYFRNNISPYRPKYSDTQSKEEAAFNFFTGRGYSREVAAGLVGNIKHESNFNPFATGDGGKAKGLAQWHPDRYNKLSQLFDLSSFQGNLEAIDHELKTSEKGAFKKILNAKTPEEAAALTDKYYERSAGLSRAQRVATARNVYSKYRNGGIF